MRQNEAVHIYNDRGPVRFVVVLLKGAMVIFGGWLFWRMATDGFQAEHFGLAVVCVVLGLFFGLADLLHLVDDRPRLTLSPDGFLDRRTGQVLAWERVGSLGYVSGELAGWALLLFPPDGSTERAGRPVRVHANYLKVRPRELVRLIQGFAPHAEVRKKYRLWLGDRSTR